MELVFQCYENLKGHLTEENFRFSLKINPTMLKMPSVGGGGGGGALLELIDALQTIVRRTFSSLIRISLVSTTKLSISAFLLSLNSLNLLLGAPA